jgi:hypothetical protein
MTMRDLHRIYGDFGGFYLELGFSSFFIATLQWGYYCSFDFWVVMLGYRILPPYSTAF